MVFPVFDQAVFNKADGYIGSVCVADGIYCVGQNMSETLAEITFDDAAGVEKFTEDTLLEAAHKL